MGRVAIREVSKRFADVTAVDHLTLEVADEEFLVLLGPSGCGKSTALRIIAGLEEPTAGTIEIGDRLVNDVEAKDRDVAMVFQSYALYPHMTVRENLAFALKLAKTPKATVDQKVTEAARILDLLAAINEKTGCTFLFSTHDLSLIARAERVIRIRDGRISGIDTRLTQAAS